MKRGTIVKWSMLVTLLMLDVIASGALAYSIAVSKVMISGNDPFILNMAMVFAVIDVALWVVTFLIIYDLKTSSDIDQRLVTLERLLMENGFNNRR